MFLLVISQRQESEESRQVLEETLCNSFDWIKLFEFVSLEKVNLKCDSSDIVDKMKY